jgi:hypothetical protein
MPFLAINGVEFPVKDGTYAETLREVGSSTVAYSGALRRQRRALKRDVRFESSPMSGAEAEMWTAVIASLGQSWSFETASGLYSSKGLGPSATSGTAATNASTYKTGAASLRLSQPSSSITYTWGTGTAPGRTLALWSLREFGSWNHYIFDDTHASGHWLNGVWTASAAPAFLNTFSATTLLLNNVDTNHRFFDDMHLWPFSLSDVPAATATAWASAIYTAASAGAAAGESPKLLLTGDAVEDATPRTCIGRVDEAKLMQGVYPSAWATDLRVLAVTLEEA